MKKTKLNAKLTLNKETIRRLQNAELEQVNGGRCPMTESSSAPSAFQTCAYYVTDTRCL